MYAAGFVGAGNMARALVRGLIDAGLFSPESLQVTDVVAGSPPGVSGGVRSGLGSGQP